MVELTLSWLASGNRRISYRGVAKNNAWWHNRAAAVNLKRMLALGLHQQEGAWRIA